MGNLFRKLRANEIEARVATVKENGVSLLLYKDARTDQNILDETFGIFGWQRSHQLIGDRLYCTVSVYDKSMDQWISKQDVGTESYTEKEKGQASDSFKRACFNFGIGRELYTAPFIWIPSNNVQIKNQNGTYKTFDRFEVKSIGYDDEGNINQLEIVNKSMVKLAYTMGTPAEDKSQKLPADKVEALRNLCKKYNDMPEDRIYKLYGKKKLEDMTMADREDFTTKWEQVTGDWMNESKA
jgi:hypothetical protein